ncbi:cytochrome P450 [Microbacterium allomyrinae]|uniref:Cytochrome P450 n=1 Tax=Microbacterium allomyrinae TaxID=2830666 RepID=A0A9X1LWN2_9MICO|nr:cytochrome P450 [Microbacterium allomyrinae]MCC2033181.1 cytochrome P450 [Microbacterium allomyrinae]
MSSSTAPVADWVTLDALNTDPLGVYRRLQEETPVAYVPAAERYFATRYEDCRFIESDPTIFTSTVPDPRDLMPRAIGHTMLRKDDPEHAADRAAINPALRPRIVADVWKPMFERNTRTRLDRLIEAGPGADLDAEFSAPLAADNLIAMLGLVGVDSTQMQRWSRTFIRAVANIVDDPDIWAECEKSNDEVDAAIEIAIPRLRAAPDDSMLSAMINGPRPVPLESVRASVKLTISGGINEPEHVLTSGVWAFARHPEQRARLIADPSRFPAAFDEVVRWLSPIGALTKLAVADVELGGFTIPAGSRVAAVVAAANRDAAQFEDPDDFSVFREKKPHLAFGSGVHLCAGSWAAKSAVGQVAWPMLYQRLAGLRPVDADAVQFRGWLFRGPTSLPVTWDEVA